VIDEQWKSLTPVEIRLYHQDRTLMEYSDVYEKTNFITYEPDRELYENFHEWSTCDMEGCTA
jgi:hypothetical protein